jgi:hypothetical protein
MSAGLDLAIVSRWPTSALSAAVLGTVLLFVAATGVVSVAFPLATYTLSLAMFGLAHVLSELRYVDVRYGHRIGVHLRWTLGILLTGVVGLRLGLLMGHIPGPVARTAEVALVLLLSVSVLPHLARKSMLAATVGLTISAALLFGLLTSPIHTLLILAILHNLTPLGFLADAVPQEHRRGVMVAALTVFVFIPLFIATGMPFGWLHGVGLATPEASILPAGPLASHFGAYLHPVFHERPWALHAFSAVVFAQCMHYAVVIHVLPRLLPGAGEPQRGLVPWPKTRMFTALVVTASAVLFVFFVWSFRDARAVYGIAAAVHAWVEIPILMLAILAGFGLDHADR